MSHLKEHQTKNLITRMNRIEGQLSGIKKMIIEDKAYDEVIIQINSTRSALQKLSQILLEAQADHSLIHVSEGYDLEDEMKKLRKVITQYNKIN
ncbi:metal-sensitive transcriptional regulator [Enterococcus casseliflavus]|uniref:metal-sensitive transcriptional regulator n=1 Tax=Enterococcus casseliflavus TaxID=37734 RepID=UPI0011A59196|nr:metal-sensitive transcriptional regulator [Enterococcus casseliflavus]